MKCVYCEVCEETVLGPKKKKKTFLKGMDKKRTYLPPTNIYNMIYIYIKYTCMLRVSCASSWRKKNEVNFLFISHRYWNDINAFVGVCVCLCVRMREREKERERARESVCEAGVIRTKEEL